MNFPTNITKEHLLKAIEKIDLEGIPKDGQSQYYDVEYNGKKYPPKVIVSYANIFANGGELDRKLFDGGVNKSAFNLLKKHGFEIKSKKQVEMKEQVRIHEIKSNSDSQENAKALLSPDKTGFYWDTKMMKKLNVGDYVFIVNPVGQKAYFTRLADKEIPATFDSSRKQKFLQS